MNDGAGGPPYKKNVFVAYFLWLIGWWFGAHHWYLERHSQAFLWMTSIGGFGVGSLLDFFYLPGYVEEANGNWLQGDRGFSFGAFVSYLCFAAYYTWLFDAEWGPYISYAIGSTVAMLALCHGRKRLWFPTPMRLAGVAFLYACDATNQDDAPYPHILAARFLATTCQGTLPDHVQTVGRRSGLSRFLMFIGTIALMVIASQHIIVPQEDRPNERITLYDGMAEAARIAKAAYKEVVKDPAATWEALMKLFYGEESKALRTLGLSKGATNAEIKKAWRGLTREYRSGDATEAKEAKLKEINQAYECLNKLYKLRGGKSDEEEERREGSGGGGFSFTFNGGDDDDDKKPVFSKTIDKELDAVTKAYNRRQRHGTKTRLEDRWYKKHDKKVVIGMLAKITDKETAKRLKSLLLTHSAEDEL